MSSRDAATTRIEILDAARALFEVDGYYSVGLDAVAKKAGVSRQAIYLHFSSKAELLHALHERVNQLDVAPAMAKVWAAKSASAALDVWVDVSAEAIPRIIDIFNALDPPRRFDADAEATWQAPAEGHYAECRRLAEWLHRDGELVAGTKVAEAADVIWSITNVKAFESFVSDRAWTVKRWSRWTKATLRRLLCEPR